jgi:hypothetical protein
MRKCRTVRQIETIVFFIILSILIEQIPITNTVFGQTGYSKRTYFNQKLGLQFQYPSPWGKAIESDSSDCHKSTCSISFVIRDPFSESIDLFIMRIDVFNLDGAVQESCDCKTLKDFVRWDYYQKFKTDNDTIVLNQTGLVNNHNSWRMKLNLVSKTEPTQKLIVWTIDANKGYRFQYSAPGHRFTEYLAGFEDMLKSFDFPEHSAGNKPTCMLFDLICY